MPRSVNEKEFETACDAVWSELLYQNQLSLRTDGEAQDVAGFLTLLRRYLRKAEDNWSDNPGVEQPDGTMQVVDTLHDLRKLAAICMRAMIYNGVRDRLGSTQE